MRGELRELVVCSLEPWDEVWRRNQFLVDHLLQRNPRLRVLFVEPPIDVFHDLLVQRRRPLAPRMRRLSPDSRLKAFRPLKPIPRRLGGFADQALLLQVRLVARFANFARPVLWINDVTYAPLIERTRWPSLYDITDDWLLAPLTQQELARLRHLEALALSHADEVVVCSSALAESRGKVRRVSLVPNGVDVEHFRHPQSRPKDLPPGPTAVYVGSLHDARLDVELVGELADALPQLNVVLVGPDTLGDESHRLLGRRPNVHLLGARPYENVPAYLQHADVLIVPHRISPFTESLDPIKAYECQAVGTPTLATPVAGFRNAEPPVLLAPPESFVTSVAELLAAANPIGYSGSRTRATPPTWEAQAVAFQEKLIGATHPRPRRGRGRTDRPE